MGTDDILARHSELLVALNEKADRQTAHLEAIEGILRALATRLDALEERIAVLEEERR